MTHTGAEPLPWAVVPVAGSGTRLHPASAVIPKALLPVGRRPMLHETLGECIQADVQGIVIIVGPDQALIREYVDAAGRAARRGERNELAELGFGLADRDVVWVEQPEPRGVGDAFLRARDTTGDDSFGVLLPDNWFHSDTPAIGQVAVAHRRTGLCALGLTAVPPDEAHLFGNVGGVSLQALGEGTHRITALQDKLPGAFVSSGEPVLRGCARYVVDGRFYGALLATGPPEEGEWDDVPAFQHLIEDAGLAGQEIEGRHYDVGREEGYLAAASYLARR